MRKRINIGYLSRVEGEGGITIEFKNGTLQRLDLKIFEAPRFFEPILKGKDFQDVIDLTARVCGICPVAYQMSSVHAIECALGFDPGEEIRQLRRLLYCSEWIESHALHVYFLHGPDLYGLESAWSGNAYLPVLQRGLKLKDLGNLLLTILGGRSVHPVSVRAGGFFSVPEQKSLLDLLPLIEDGFEASLEGIKWSASLFHDKKEEIELRTVLVSLKDPEGYPMNHGRIITSDGDDFSMEGFLSAIEEYQVPHSTAMHCGLKKDTGRTAYLTGPISRLNLNYDDLPMEIKTIMANSGIVCPVTDMKKSIIARSIEIAYAFHEAVRIIKHYKKPRPFTEVEPKVGKATWITEAPRGILIHSYEFDRYGKVSRAIIIPPTSQNLAHIENALREYVTTNMDHPHNSIRNGCEQIVRSYDPCISCSVHVIEKNV